MYPISNFHKFIPHLPTFFIVNTDAHSLPGTHRKCIFIDKERRSEIFDSLALPINDILVRWMNGLLVNGKLLINDINDLPVQPAELLCFTSYYRAQLLLPYKLRLR